MWLVVVVPSLQLNFMPLTLFTFVALFAQFKTIVPLAVP
jgi:hypothetical protein